MGGDEAVYSPRYYGRFAWHRARLSSLSTMLRWGHISEFWPKPRYDGRIPWETPRPQIVKPLNEHVDQGFPLPNPPKTVMSKKQPFTAWNQIQAMVRYSSCVTRSDAAACRPCSHCGDDSQSAASTPTCVIANAINDQADAQGLALHPISLFRYMLERKAEIVKTLDTAISPKVPPTSFLLDFLKHHHGKWVTQQGQLEVITADISH